MAWVLRGLREGIVTTRYPKRADDYGANFKGSLSVRTSRTAPRPGEKPLEPDEMSAVEKRSSPCGLESLSDRCHRGTLG